MLQCHGWKTRLLRMLAAALAVLCLFPSLCPLEAAAEAAPGVLPLKQGDKGPEVRQVKEQLKALRYTRAQKLNALYNEDCEKLVRQFQELNGLPVTGEVDEATWNRLFAGDAVKYPYPTMPPLASPEPTPVPDWPERDEEGFLAGSGEYWYENDEGGLWIYLSPTLSVTVTRRRDRKIPLEWFETDIRTRGDEALRTVATNPKKPGTNFKFPYVIAREENFVLGFSDDFYGLRIHDGSTVGIILREGEIIREKTNKSRGFRLPNLDVMAQFPDGTLKVFECNEKTAQELKDMSAVNVFSFGPILIRNGQIDNLVYDHFKSLEPRQALGMIAPNHFFLLSVQGRNSDSRGCPLQRVAEIMQAHGVTEALNLDGGNTMALIFRGRMLNKLAVYKKRKFVRSLTSLIGIGHSEIPDR